VRSNEANLKWMCVMVVWFCGIACVVDFLYGTVIILAPVTAKCERVVWHKSYRC